MHTSLTHKGERVLWLEETASREDARRGVLRGAPTRGRLPQPGLCKSPWHWHSPWLPGGTVGVGRVCLAPEDKDRDSNASFAEQLRHVTQLS